MANAPALAIGEIRQENRNMFNRECQLLSSRFATLVIILCVSFLLTACGSSTAAFLAKGEEYLQKRKFHDAMMQFRSAAESDSGSAGAHWGLARAYESLGQFNDVLDELRKTVELDDSNLEAKAKLGNYFLLVQPPMIAETEKLRNDILLKDPNFIEAQILGATIMAAKGSPDADVINAVNKAISMDPKRVESYVSLERLYMTREKPAEAEAAIRRAIEANPASVLGYTEYGRFLMYAARNKEAEDQFNKAVGIDNTSIEAREALAEFYVNNRQLEKAEQAYLELVKIQDNSPESRLELADFYNLAGRKDEAIATLDQILEASPEYVLARYRLGELYLDRRDIAKVNEQLEALFKINDDDIEGLMLRARANLQEGKAAEAVKDLDEVLKKTPSGREALFLMAQARISAGQIEMANAYISDLERYHPNFIKAGLLRIQAAFTAGDPQSALKYANDVLTKTNAATPNADLTPEKIHDLQIRAITSRGLANLDLGKFNEAKADLTDVLEMAPKSGSAMVNLAKVHVAERKFDLAIDLYAKALASEPQNFDAASGWVSTSIQLGQTVKAHAKVDEILAANAGKGEVEAALHYLKSTIYAAEKNFAATEAELTRSIGLDEDYFPAYSAYASLLTQQNRTEEAVSQYQRLIEKRPTAQIYTMLGILEESRGNMTAAEDDYRKALEITPETPIAGNNLAWMIVDKNGNLDEALQLATMAVTKSPTTAGFLDTLGWVYLKKGLALPAVEQFKKAVAMEEASAKRTGAVPNPGYRVRLGMALAKAGDRASAKREVEASLQRVGQLNQREVSDAKGLLATL